AHGASIMNDIGAGRLNEDMLTTVAVLDVPYVVMHMQGTPKDMQNEPLYSDVVEEVVLFLSQRINAAHKAGIADVIIDPGFGFGKTTVHNYALLNGLEQMVALGYPVLVGVSRKRMINEVLGISSGEALHGTSILNTIAIMNGAVILRVHDVKEAVQVIKLVAATR
ncbi:MAG TPA: dihydropteroate synthase, partial [Flavobacteriales bacterium]|nr:dihydropteroate synthase [Flavobacteriales bacterium]